MKVDIDADKVVGSTSSEGFLVANTSDGSMILQRAD